MNTQEVTTKLNWVVEAGLKVRTKLADNLLKSNGDAEYQIRWLEGHYKTIKSAQLAEFGLSDGVQRAVGFAKMQLDCWRPQSSTSAYSNACHNEAHEAYRDFIRDFERFVSVEAKAA